MIRASDGDQKIERHSMVRHMQHMPHMPINVELKGFTGFLDFALAEHQAETETQYIIKKTKNSYVLFIIYWVSVSVRCSASAKSRYSKPRRPLDQHFVSTALCIWTILRLLRDAKVDFDWQVTRMVHFQIFEPSFGASISKPRWRLNLLASDRFGIKAACLDFVFFGAMLYVAVCDRPVFSLACIAFDDVGASKK